MCCGGCVFLTGVSHRELAHRSGIKNRDLSRYQRGLAVLSREDAEKVARALELQEGDRDFLLAACGYGENEQITMARHVEDLRKGEGFVKLMEELEVLINNCLRLSSAAQNIRQQLTARSSSVIVMAFIEEFRGRAKNQRAIVSQIFGRLSLRE